MRFSNNKNINYNNNNNSILLYLRMGGCCVVGTVISYELEDRGIGVRAPVV
jgi:hypothetical protein